MLGKRLILKTRGTESRLWLGGHSWRAAIGKGGLTENKREGDGATPVGCWPLRELLVRPDRGAVPASGLPARTTEESEGWCDDPEHPDYNRPVRLPFAASHETLWRADHLYDLIVPMGYNDDPPEPGRGSAIFLHLARDDYGPTEGCIALARKDLLALLPVLGLGDEILVLPPEKD